MNTLKLYEVTDAIMEVMDNPDATDEELESAFMALTDKAGGVAAVYKNMDATVAALKTEIDRLATAKKRIESRQDWLKGYVLTQMEKLQVDELKSGIHTLKKKLNPPAVVVDDESLIPAKFIKIVQTQSVDKIGIKEELQKGGGFVPGVHLHRGVGVIIK